MSATTTDPDVRVVRRWGKSRCVNCHGRTWLEISTEQHLVRACPRCTSWLDMGTMDPLSVRDLGDVLAAVDRIRKQGSRQPFSWSELIEVADDELEGLPHVLAALALITTGATIRGESMGDLAEAQRVLLARIKQIRTTVDRMVARTPVLADSSDPAAIALAVAIGKLGEAFDPEVWDPIIAQIEVTE